MPSTMPACRPASRNIANKFKFAAGQNLKGSNGAEIGEAGIEVLGVHGKADAVGGAGIFLGAIRVAINFEGLDADAQNLASLCVGGVDTLGISAVQYIHPIRGKVAPADAALSGQDFGFQCELTVGRDGIEADTSAKAGWHIVIGDDVMRLIRTDRKTAGETKAHQQHRG